jgi:hypothetical protein
MKNSVEWNESKRTLCNAAVLLWGSAQSYDQGAVIDSRIVHYGSTLFTPLTFSIQPSPLV